jgi:SAM-dependent methyltransferase
VDPLPAGFDLITFKSFLHDWPDSEARRLIASASNALAPGGTLLIFERGPLPASFSYAMIPLLPFFRSFRSPDFYHEQLGAVGLRDIRIQEVELEMKFFLVTGSLAP